MTTDQTARAVECPRCGAEPDQPCTFVTLGFTPPADRTMKTVNIGRIVAARSAPPLASITIGTGGEHPVRIRRPALDDDVPTLSAWTDEDVEDVEDPALGAAPGSDPLAGVEGGGPLG